jgi:hypothetical protein
VALTQADRKSLMAAVDRSPRLHLAGIAYIGPNFCELVRKAPAGMGTKLYVTFQVQPREASSAPDASPPPASKLNAELLQMGLSCTSVALWAIGTIFFAAAAAPTMGATGVAGYVSGAATAASAIQCVASGYRVYNDYTGNTKDNEKMDALPGYEPIMLGLDAMQLAGAGIAFKAATSTFSAIARSGVTLTKTTARLESASRPMRKAITAALGNPNGAIRLQSIALTARLRSDIMSSLGVGLDLSGSATGGVLNELIVWLSETK